MSSPIYTLTPADVQMLRDSVRWKLSDHLHDIGAPYIQWGPAERVYILHAYGHTVAQSADAEPLLACLRCERAEPGFIDRIVMRSEPCDIASLQPDLRIAALAQQRAEQAAARATQAQRDALDTRMAELRRTRLTKPAGDIDLDDLLAP